MSAPSEPFLVDVGGMWAGPGERLGELATIERTDVFRIAAPGRAAAETAAVQLFHAAATRERHVVREPWARARNGAI
jgi:hypothetical protein